MAEELLLIEDVPGLGAAGDVVKVATGYARNYLVPRKLAAPLTALAQRRVEKIREERAKREARTVEEARSRKAELEKAGCTVAMKAGEGGKLFGSVTATLIVETMVKQGWTLDRHQVELEEPIRELGVFTVPVRLHPEAVASLKVWVVEE